jgi:hypothetical protein
MMINAASFRIEDFGNRVAYGTVEVTLGRETRRVRALSFGDGYIVAYGITGRYRTGMKAWPGSITLQPGFKNEHVSFGFDSRSGKHHKATISFA